jgi:hypothetical protein
MHRIGWLKNRNFKRPEIIARYKNRELKLNQPIQSQDRISIGISGKGSQTGFKNCDTAIYCIIAQNQAIHSAE